MVLHVGCDLGTSTIKISCGDVTFLIPSVIGETNPGWSGASFDKTLENNLVITEGRDSWYVGE